MGSKVLFFVKIISFFFSVKFEHGEVDAEAFQNWKAKFKICTHKNDENVKENAEDMRGPEVKLRIKSDFATYYSTAKSLSGKFVSR